jgi:hypothetical protein
LLRNRQFHVALMLLQLLSNPVAIVCMFGTNFRKHLLQDDALDGCFDVNEGDLAQVGSPL